MPKRWLDHVEKPEAIYPVTKFGAFAEQSPPFNTHGLRLFRDESMGGALRQAHAQTMRVGSYRV